MWGESLITVLYNLSRVARIKVLTTNLTVLTFSNY